MADTGLHSFPPWDWKNNYKRIWRNQIKQIHQEIILTDLATDLTQKNDLFINETFLLLTWTLINSSSENNNIKMCLLITLFVILNLDMQPQSSFTDSGKSCQDILSFVFMFFPEKTKSHRLATTPGWVNNDRELIFGWTIPLKKRKRNRGAELTQRGSLMGTECYILSLSLKIRGRQANTSTATSCSSQRALIPPTPWHCANALSGRSILTQTRLSATLSYWKEPPRALLIVSRYKPHTDTLEWI